MRQRTALVSLVLVALVALVATAAADPVVDLRDPDGDDHGDQGGSGGDRAKEGPKPGARAPGARVGARTLRTTGGRGPRRGPYSFSGMIATLPSVMSTSNSTVRSSENVSAS